MKKNSKQRLFEVVSRLDKTFKPNLNEELEGVDMGSESELSYDDIKNQMNATGTKNFIANANPETLKFLFGVDEEFNMPPDVINRDSREVYDGLIEAARNRKLKISDFANIWSNIYGETNNHTFNNSQLVDVLRYVYKV